MAKNRIRLGVLAAVVGLPIYLSVQAASLHEQPQTAPSVIHRAPSPQWSESVNRARQIMRSGLGEQNLPGLSVAVGIDGDIVWAEGFGWSDIAARAPVTPDTEFRIGTASSVLTSAAVGLLVERNGLELDEQIQTYVPQFPKKPRPVTLRQLMGHVAGLGTDSGDQGPLFHQRCERLAEALPHFADGDLLFEPGTQYKSSKYGWVVASAAVEAGAGQPFQTFMREQIFDPLGMSHTWAESATEENPDHIGEPSEDAPPVRLFVDVFLKPLGFGPPDPKPGDSKRATSYVPRFGADPRRGQAVMRPHNLSCYAGSMAFLSTPSDLVRFGLAFHGGKLLRPATVQQLQASQKLSSGQATGHGLGWDLETVTLAGKKTRAAGHDGELFGGRVVSLRTFPERRMVVAVMSNITNADTSALARRVAEAFAADASATQGSPQLGEVRGSRGLGCAGRAAFKKKSAKPQPILIHPDQLPHVLARSSIPPLRYLLNDEGLESLGQRNVHRARLVIRTAAWQILASTTRYLAHPQASLARRSPEAPPARRYSRHPGSWPMSPFSSGRTHSVRGENPGRRRRVLAATARGARALGFPQASLVLCSGSLTGVIAINYPAVSPAPPGRSRC